MTRKVGYAGVGAMGLAMAKHTLAAGFEVTAFDISSDRLAEAAASGLRTTDSLASLATLADIFIVVVATDAQSIAVTSELAKAAAPGSLIAVAATNAPATMQALGAICAAHKIRFIDAPVVYGMQGALAGRLLSLCGGAAVDVEFAREVLSTYSRDVVHLGGLGTGQLGKACNNMLHWIHCVSNYEALLLAKRYGIDAQRMREVLLVSPGRNGTLEDWDGTRFTWHEKDMDLVLELAQEAKLTLPLTAHVDQLIKLFSADNVRDLLYGPTATYLGRQIVPLTASEGALV